MKDQLEPQHTQSHSFVKLVTSSSQFDLNKMGREWPQARAQTQPIAHVSQGYAAGPLPAQLVGNQLGQPLAGVSREPC